MQRQETERQETRGGAASHTAHRESPVAIARARATAMTLRATAMTLVTIAALFVSGSCDKPGGDVVLVTGTSLEITRDDLLKRARELSPSARRDIEHSSEARRRLLGELLRHRLLVDEAKRRGLDQRPALRRQIEELLVRSLVADVKKNGSTPDESGDIDAEVAALRARHDRPAKVRATVVWFPAENEAKEAFASLVRRRARGGRGG